MHPQNFMIFGTYKLYNAKNEKMLSLCNYVNSYTPRGRYKHEYFPSALEQFYFLLIFYIGSLHSF